VFAPRATSSGAAAEVLDDVSDFGRLERRGYVVVREKFAWGATTVGSIVDDLGRGLDVPPMLFGR
jgi:hypothetical protein